MMQAKQFYIKCTKTNFKQMNSQQLKLASDILKAQYPQPLISKTTDVYKDLKPIERQILFESDRMLVKRLQQFNERF